MFSNEISIQLVWTTENGRKSPASMGTFLSERTDSKKQICIWYTLKPPVRRNSFPVNGITDPMKLKALRHDTGKETSCLHGISLRESLVLKVYDVLVAPLGKLEKDLHRWVGTSSGIANRWNHIHFDYAWLTHVLSWTENKETHEHDKSLQLYIRADGGNPGKSWKHG